MKSGKVWGETQSILEKNGVSIHRLVIAPGGFCSMHRHAHKTNFFHVEKGAMEIHERMSYGLTDVTRLESGDSHSVAPGNFHKFRSQTGCIALEIYYAEPPRADDIEREDHGGLANA